MIGIAALLIATAIVATLAPKYNNVRYAHHIAALGEQVQHWQLIRSEARYAATEEEMTIFRMDDAAFQLHIANYYEQHGEHTAANTARQRACYLAQKFDAEALEKEYRKGGVFDVKDNDTVVHYFDEEEALAAQQRVAIKTGTYHVGNEVELSTQKVLANQ